MSVAKAITGACIKDDDYVRAICAEVFKKIREYLLLWEREYLIEFLKSHRFNLIETLTDQCAKLLLHKFTSMQWLQLHLAKLSVFPDAEGTGIVIERGRE